jgi:ribonuclease Y
MNFLANIDLVNIIWLGCGCLVGFLFKLFIDHKKRASVLAESEKIIQKAKSDAEAIIREAKISATDEINRKREELRASMSARKQELAELEKRVEQREALINKQLESIIEREKVLQQQSNELKKREASLNLEKQELSKQAAHWREKLIKLSHLTEEEARALVLKEIEQEAIKDAVDLTRKIVEDAKAKAESEARRILSIAIQRYAGEHAFETTTATVDLPNEELKGRIIGREGRNIRAFEAATGVTVLIDDTPNAVVLSSFDPVRREIARESMIRLLQDGRIHPTRIEEITAKVAQEIEETIVKSGEEAVLSVGLPPLHPEITKMLGRLKFRHSFSQNLLEHSIEVAHIAGCLASELSLSVSVAKRAGLLHDIGKAINHEIEGAHAIVGADFLKRFGESDEVVNGVASHHEDVPHDGPIGVLVSAADAISASRPGSRSETMSTYIKRLEELEKIGLSFPGVDRCYAVQAGRELRVMVKPELTTDDQAFMLARKLANKIEEELQYPGQIKITVIRETRCIEYAK